MAYRSAPLVPIPTKIHLRVLKNQSWEERQPVIISRDLNSPPSVEIRSLGASHLFSDRKSCPLVALLHKRVLLVFFSDKLWHWPVLPTINIGTNLRLVQWFGRLV